MKKIYVTILTIAMMTLLMSCGSTSSSSESDGSEYEAYIAELENENESLSNYADELAEYSDELISAGNEMLAALESISAENEELQGQLGFSDEEDTTVVENTTVSYDSIIYSDDYIDIEFAYSSYGLAVFKFTNKCDKGVMVAGCDYITLDGTEYSYDDTGDRSGWATEIATGDTRSYEVIMLAADSHEEIPAETFSTISGVFWCYIEDTDVSEEINIPEMSIK